MMLCIALSSCARTSFRSNQPSHPETMPSRLALFTLLLGIALLSLVPSAAAFGAGNIPSFAFLSVLSLHQLYRSLMSR
jgi:hypothetical protein